MQTKKQLGARAINFILFALLLVFLLNGEAKVWLLRQLVAIGLFTPEIKKEADNKHTSSNASSFSFQDSNGNVKTTSDLKGKVVFINFWASWCPPCRAEMPSLKRLYNELRNDNRFVFLFINEDDDLATAKEYLQKNGFDMPLYFRTTSMPSAIFSGTLPTTVVVDAKGNIVMKHEGIGAFDTPEFISQLRKLL